MSSCNVLYNDINFSILLKIKLLESSNVLVNIFVTLGLNLKIGLSVIRLYILLYIRNMYVLIPSLTSIAEKAFNKKFFLLFKVVSDLLLILFTLLTYNIFKFIK